MYGNKKMPEKTVYAFACTAQGIFAAYFKSGQKNPMRCFSKGINGNHNICMLLCL
jgi:hypothetical protein